jgi:FkbM family methyltransferase
LSIQSRVRSAGRRARLSFASARVFRNYRDFLSALDGRGDGVVLTTRSGVKLKIRGNTWDAKIVREQFVERFYVRDMPQLPTGAIVVDIGAYIGDFALYASEELGARVFAYEPTAENFALLSENVALNSAAGRVAALQQAVGPDGHLTLNVEADNDDIHSSAYWYDGAEARQVESVSLDTLIAEHNLDRIDLLKVDCEGGEYDILPTATDDALAKVAAVVAELHDIGPATEQSQDSVRARLRDAGFVVSETPMSPRTSILRARR